MRSFFSNIVLEWVVTEIVWKNRKGLVKIAILDVLGIASTVGAYALLFGYVNTIENEQELTLLGNAFDPRSSLSMLLLTAICTGVLFVLSSLASFRAQIDSLNQARSFEVVCSQNIMKLLEKKRGIDRYMSDNPDDLSLRDISRALLKDSRFCGQTIELISNSIVNISKIIAGIVLMLYLHFFLTIIIFLMGIPLLIIIRNIARRVITLTKDKEIYIQKFIGYKKNLIKELILKNNSGVSSIDWNDTYNKKDIKGFYDAHYGVRKRMQLNRLLLWCFIAVLTIVLVGIAGNLVLFGSMSWTVFIAYMVALRFLFGSINGFEYPIRMSGKVYDYLNHYIFVYNQLSNIPEEYAKDASMSGLYDEDDENRLEAYMLELDDDEGDDEF